MIELKKKDINFQNQRLEVILLDGKQIFDKLRKKWKLMKQIGPFNKWINMNQKEKLI